MRVNEETISSYKKGFSVQLNSSDHNPPHVHVKNNNHITILKLCIPGFRNFPEFSKYHERSESVDTSDIITTDKRNLSNSEKKKFVEMWNEEYDGDKRWYYAKMLWITKHAEVK